MEENNTYFLTRFVHMAKKAGYKWLLLFLSCFILWGLFGLAQSPGFSLDEGEIVDSAIHFANEGYLACPSLGPGFGHDEAFLYQTPLSSICLGLVYKIFGAGVLQGRLLSLFLFVIILVLVYLAMRPFGPFASLIAVLLLACDPLFCRRAREVRYDGLALIGTMGAFILLFNNTSSKTHYSIRCLLAGLLLGFAVNAHVLYLLYGLVFGLLILIPFDSESQFRKRVLNLLLFSVGIAASLLPFTYYVLNHWGAFMDQFVFLVKYDKQQYSGINEIFMGEVSRYITYYKLTPCLFLLYISSLGTGIFLLWRLYKTKGVFLNPLQYRYFKQALFIGLLSPVLLACVSNGKHWHHLMIAPFWAMLASLVLSLCSKMKGKIFCTYAISILLVLGLCNGALVSWGLRTYSALASWGTRDVSATQIKEHVPPGSSVYGDYHLIFLAWEEHWQYVQEQYILRTDDKLFSQIPYDYLIYSDYTKGLANLNMNNYEKVAEIQPAEPRIALPKLNSGNIPLRLRIYKRIEDIHAPIRGDGGLVVPEDWMSTQE